MKEILQPEIRLLTTGESIRSEFSWGELSWYASRELGNSEDVTVGCCRIRPGDGNPRHCHPNCSEILTVIQGRIRHTIDSTGAEVEMSAGDTVTIPPHIWHKATNIGNSEAILFIVFTSADRETIGE